MGSDVVGLRADVTNKQLRLPLQVSTHMMLLQLQRQHCTGGPQAGSMHLH